MVIEMYDKRKITEKWFLNLRDNLRSAFEQIEIDFAKNKKI